MAGSEIDPRRVAPARILVIQTAFLGDVVLTTPLLRELRRCRPGAHLCLLTSEAGRQAIRAGGQVDETLVLRKSWGPEGIRSYAEVLRRLRRAPFNVAIAAHRSVRSGLLARLSGASLRIGFAGAPGSWAYDRPVRWDGSRHAVRRYLELARPAGGDPARADAHPELQVDAEADRRVAELLRGQGLDDGRDLLCVAPGSNRETKRWLPAGFAEVVAAATRRGLAPVLIGAPDERELCCSIARLADGGAAVLAGRMGIPELVALLARSRAVVCNDSGPAHVASALHVPVVSVFGATSPRFGYVAYGSSVQAVEHPDLDCRPCSSRGPRRCPRGHFRCMREVRPEQVLAALDELLERTDVGQARPQRAVSATVLPG